jgi:hypothetical protein
MVPCLTSRAVSGGVPRLLAWRKPLLVSVTLSYPSEVRPLRGKKSGHAHRPSQRGSDRARRRGGHFCPLRRPARPRESATPTSPFAQRVGPRRASNGPFPFLRPTGRAVRDTRSLDAFGSLDTQNLRAPPPRGWGKERRTSEAVEPSFGCDDRASRGVVIAGPVGGDACLAEEDGEGEARAIVGEELGHRGGPLHDDLDVHRLARDPHVHADL